MRDGLTTVYFVRHAEPVHVMEDRIRPLTEEGMRDTALVLETLRDKGIEVFYSSPYKRSMDTIRSTAEYYGMSIIPDERLRERKAGNTGNVKDMFRKRWADHSFHEPEGESLDMVQERNIEALKEILVREKGRKIVIGTHGTALSTIFNYYDPTFGCDDFLRIIDWMPYIVEMTFDGEQPISKTELAYLAKPFRP